MTIKFFESHFAEYVASNKRKTLHPYYSQFFDDLRFQCQRISDLPHFIFYGKSGVGKYTQALSLISRYSPSELKYEKKVTINFQNKQDVIFKLSDAHFEIDMGLMGVHAKLAWLEVFNQILDIMSSSFKTANNYSAFILLKNFHEIHTELLDVFYSYMQMPMFASYNVRFILLTESVSFLPTNIVNICKILRFSIPATARIDDVFAIDDEKEATINSYKTDGVVRVDNMKKFKFKKEYKQLVAKPGKSGATKQVAGAQNLNIPEEHKLLSDNIYNIVIKPRDKIQLDKLRDYIYDMLTYQLNVYNIVWRVIERLINEGKVSIENCGKIVGKSYYFLLYYNNNYRPIYHIENFILYIIKHINVS